MAEREKLTILFPFQESVTYLRLSDDTVHDLGFDAVCEQVTADPKERAMILQVLRSVTPDLRVAVFRRGVFADILSHPDLRNRLMKLLDHVKFLNDFGVNRRQTDETSGLWDLLHRLDELRDYIDTVEAIEACLQDDTLQSEGLRKLREGIDAIWRDSGFDALKKDIAGLRADTDRLKSVTVGINLNERFEAVSAGLVSVNSKPFTRSGVLRHFAEAISRNDQIRPSEEWNGDMSWHPLNSVLDTVLHGAEQLSRTAVAFRNPLLALTLSGMPEGDGTRELPRTMDTALNNLLTSVIRRLRDVLNRYAAVSIREVADLIPELMYYVRWAEYVERLTRQGWRFTEPEPCEAEDGVPGMAAEGFYNLKLTLAEKPETVVPNSLVFDREKRVYLLTGANRGGKTTVTQAVGQLFLLAQGGLSVPAERFVYTPADGVYTHFPADEDKTMNLGRLGEECRRFREIYLQCTERSLLLLNETFSTTSFEEGYDIAADAVRALLRKGTRTIFNTHMHKLARDAARLSEGSMGPKAFSLVARSDGGKRSFRIAVGPPEGSSFAHDIAEKYGVTYEQLTEPGEA